MKRILLLFVVLVYSSISLFSANVTISISGLGYQSSSNNIMIGDIVTIEASSTHPLVQVDKTTWDANKATPMAGGWGTKTSNYTFTATTKGMIYFVCSAHVSLGMKSSINVLDGNGVEDGVSNLTNTQIYPNPSNGNFTLKFTLLNESQVSISLIDLIGNEIETKNLEKTNLNSEVNMQYNTNGLVKGIYYLRIKSANSEILKSLVIE